MPAEYTLYIANVEVLYVGESLSNLFVLVGDTHRTSDLIRIIENVSQSIV